MQTLKQQAINIISNMPEPIDIDQLMYRLYVIDKIRKGKEAAENEQMISVEDLEREIEKW